MLTAKLNGHKTVKLGGVRFTIRKLTPALFMDKETFPLNNIIENVKAKGEIKPDEVNQYKETIKGIILKGVVSVGYWFESKAINELIGDIMERPELYNALFITIMNHAFGQKKNNLIRLFSPEDMRFLFTGWLKPIINSRQK